MTTMFHEDFPVVTVRYRAEIVTAVTLVEWRRRIAEAVATSFGSRWHLGKPGNVSVFYHQTHPSELGDYDLKVTVELAPDYHRGTNRAYMVAEFGRQLSAIVGESKTWLRVVYVEAVHSDLSAVVV